jgi:hypothetical protein
MYGGGGAAATLALVHGANAIRRLRQRLDESIRLRRGADHPLSGLERAIAARSDDLDAVDLHEMRDERRALVADERDIDRPILLRHKRADLFFSLDDQPKRDGLHPPRGEEVPVDLTTQPLPEHRGELVPDEAVEDAPRLLREEPLLIDGARLREPELNTLLGDLVKLDTSHRPLERREFLRDVPSDRFSLTVRVWREKDLIGLLRRLLQIGEDVLVVLEHLVLRRVAVGDVDVQPRLGQVAHVSLGREHDEVLAEVFLNGLRLGRRLDDDERLGHLGRAFIWSGRQGTSALLACTRTRGALTCVRARKFRRIARRRARATTGVTSAARVDAGASPVRVEMASGCIGPSSSVATQRDWAWSSGGSEAEEATSSKAMSSCASSACAWRRVAPAFFPRRDALWRPETCCINGPSRSSSAAKHVVWP